MTGDNPTPDGEFRAGHALGKIDRVVRPIALYFGGFLAVALCFWVVTAVGFRYILNSPISGVLDISQLILVSIVAVSVAQSGRTGSQVVVEILGSVSNHKITRWTDIFVKSIGAVMMAILCVQLILNGMDAAVYGEASNTLFIPFGPFFYLLGAGMALYGIVLLFEIYVHLRGGEVVHHVGTMDDL